MRTNLSQNDAFYSDYEINEGYFCLKYFSLQPEFQKSDGHKNNAPQLTFINVRFKKVCLERQ
jgi:hypothetical protein